MTYKFYVVYVQVTKKYGNNSPNSVSQEVFVVANSPQEAAQKASQQVQSWVNLQPVGQYITTGVSILNAKELCTCNTSSNIGVGMGRG